ncbi:MAG: hypothetical protein ABW196_06270 [Solirubrobacterales bacterium]
MTTKTRKFRPSPAIVISCLALFLALTGSAFAVGVGKNTVRSAQIVDSTVRTVDLRDNAVSSPKIADATVTATDLATDSVGSDEIAKDAVNSDEIAKDAVKTDEIADNAVASPEVAPDSLTAGDLALGSVTSSEIANQTIESDDIGANAVHAEELGGTVLRTNTKSLAAGTNGSISVPCQAGEQVLSGGGAPSNYGVEMTSNAPSGNGWFYAASNKTGATQTITVYALCLS